MADYEPVIGLEIHVQLNTRTKMFCGCELSFGDPPNTHTCPVCLGLPGTLPVVNERAIHFGLMIGLALGCEIAERSIFHRKNYFYPDLPKGYQISQYDIPLCRGGRLGDVRIHRVHLEEDAAKLTHISESGRIHGADRSWVDFNRGGTPLVEIVTEPDVHSAKAASDWLKLLRTTLQRLGVSDVRMEEGSLRCDANVSVRPAGTTALGTKTELKNMNSFSFIEKGIQAEIERQTRLLRAGEPVVQETLHFDPATQRLTPLRSKEEAHDYRYFPEPDLVPLAPDADWQTRVRDGLGAMPAERRARLADALGGSPSDAETDQIRAVVDLGLDALVTAAADAGAPTTLALARAANEVAAQSEAGLRLDPAAFAGVLGMEAGGQLSATQSKAVLGALLERGGGDPATLAAEMGFEALGTDTLSAVVDEVVDAHPDEWARFAGGEDKLMGFFTGKVMQATSGKANGKEVAAELRRRRG